MMGMHATEQVIIKDSLGQSYNDIQTTIQAGVGQGKVNNKKFFEEEIKNIKNKIDNHSFLDHSKPQPPFNPRTFY